MDDGGMIPPTSNKAPGWYPYGSNPNDQAYWDGRSWTSTRRWQGAGWVHGDAPGAPDEAAPPPPSGPVAQPPWTARPPLSARPRPSPATLKGGPLLMMICGIVVMIGSATPWIAVSLLGASTSVSGMDISTSSNVVSGWFTFTGGVVLLLLGGLEIVSDEASFRLLAVLVSLATLGIAIYDMVRVVQVVSKGSSTVGRVPVQLGTSASVGFGLIILLLAALGAAAAAVLELRSS